MSHEEGIVQTANNDWYVGSESYSGKKIRSPKGRAGSSPAIGNFVVLQHTFRVLDLMNTNGTRHETVSARAVCAFADEPLAQEKSEDEARSVNSPILLASSSPRRAHILQTLGVSFRVVKSTFEEPLPSSEDHAHPSLFVEHLAREKARMTQFATQAATQCATQLEENALVLSADTIVWHDGEILGKPQNPDAAISMLRRLRGQEHRVYTGVCLRRVTNENIEYSNDHSDTYSMSHAVTTVSFNDVSEGISDDWIRAYVATGEPMDKAGSYGAQDKGALLVRRIDGDFWNVVGLPLAPLSKLLREAGAPIENYWRM